MHVLGHGSESNMTAAEIYVVAVLAATMALFVWGRWRYDIVALMALLAVVVGGIIPAEEAFSGFGHPAVITVAAVLAISRAIQNSGLIGWLSRGLERSGHNTTVQTGAVVVLVAALSAFMNNVGALALLLPVVIQVARKSDRSPGDLLMPLSFGSLLGGLVTLIGTPPNIIVATYRTQTAGSPFGMFDFAPVGLAVAVAGGLFIALVGWRLLPKREAGGSKDMFKIADYITEVVVSEGSKAEGITIGELLAPAGEGEIVVVALRRGERRYLRPGQYNQLRADDHLLMEGSAEAIESVIHEAGLTLEGTTSLDPADLQSDVAGIVEAVVTPASPLVNRTVSQTMLGWRQGLNLLALAREGRPLRSNLRQARLQAGDVLLLLGNTEAMPEALASIGCLPLAQRDLALHRTPSPLPLIIFAVAIGLGVFGLLSIPVAFTAAVVALVLTRSLTLRELYASVDWPVVVLLAAMVPVGAAVEASGTSALIVDGIARMSETLPPWSVVLVVLVAAMALSDIMNNAATAVLMAPLAIGVASRMGVSPDPLLMAVAVGSSCAFLTPIGHQSNVLVMGPAGYRFGDYWRMGLPLEILIVVVALPVILWVWPLQAN
jgi:di/tricarboxylate transporter